MPSRQASHVSPYRYRSKDRTRRAADTRVASFMSADPANRTRMSEGPNNRRTADASSRPMNTCRPGVESSRTRCSRLDCAYAIPASRPRAARPVDGRLPPDGPPTRRSTPCWPRPIASIWMASRTKRSGATRRSCGDIRNRTPPTTDSAGRSIWRAGTSAARRHFATAIDLASDSDTDQALGIDGHRLGVRRKCRRGCQPLPAGLRPSHGRRPFLRRLGRRQRTRPPVPRIRPAGPRRDLVSHRP